MLSERKLRAVRANGALGKGRKTPEGLVRSAANSVTHGLNARNLVLDYEAKADYEKLREICLLELKPQTPFEAVLVDDVIAARWRLERMVSIETALLDLEMKEQKDKVDKDFKAIDADSRLALAFRSAVRSTSAAPAALAHLGRYEARFRRAWTRALQTLHDLRAAQKQKLQNEANPKIEHPDPTPASDAGDGRGSAGDAGDAGDAPG